MTYQRLGPRPLDYRPVRYAGSRLTFRGPRRDLGQGYVACLGGTETFGSLIARPWPDLLEAGMGTACVNFGLPNAGPDVFLADEGMLRILQGARAAVLQIPPSMNLANSHYRVHPRRNDRFLSAEAPLRALYPEVDFTEFNFTRHMMQRLETISPERFARLRAAVQRAWVARMRRLITATEAPVILLWMARHAPGTGTEGAGVADDPAFVSRAMLDAIAPRAAATVVAVASAEARAHATQGMHFSPVEESLAASLPGPAAHREAAEALHAPLAGCLTR